MNAQLPARYDAMCRAIDAAYDVDEVKAIRDKALAWEIYERLAHNVEAERRACEIRLRSERRAGKLLKNMKKATGGDAARARSNQSIEQPKRLRDLGVSKDESSRWQKLAAVPQKQFDDALKDTITKPTTNGIIREATKPKLVQVSGDALWLCGRLKDFERMGFLAQSPQQVMSTMVDTMLEEVHRLAPKVATWLKRIGATDD